MTDTNSSQTKHWLVYVFPQKKHSSFAVCISCSKRNSFGNSRILLERRYLSITNYACDSIKEKSLVSKNTTEWNSQLCDGTLICRCSEQSTQQDGIATSQFPFQKFLCRRWKVKEGGLNEFDMTCRLLVCRWVSLENFLSLFLDCSCMNPMTRRNNIQWKAQAVALLPYESCQATEARIDVWIVNSEKVIVGGPPVEVFWIALPSLSVSACARHLRMSSI